MIPLFCSKFFKLRFVFELCSQFYCLSIGAKQFGAVLGEVVMEGNVVVFDRGNHKIGFASSNLTDPETGRPCGKPSLYFSFSFPVSTD